MIRERFASQVQIPFYWLLVGLIMCLISPTLAVVLSVKINNHTIAESERTKAATRDEVRERTCRLIASQINVYDEAVTPVGKDARRVWLQEYQIQGCQPPRN